MKKSRFTDEPLLKVRDPAAPFQGANLAAATKRGTTLEGRLTLAQA
jgi:hypothetical protein